MFSDQMETSVTGSVAAVPLRNGRPAMGVRRAEVHPTRRRDHNLPRLRPQRHRLHLRLPLRPTTYLRNGGANSIPPRPGARLLRRGGLTALLLRRDTGGAEEDGLGHAVDDGHHRHGVAERLCLRLPRLC